MPCASALRGWVDPTGHFSFLCWDVKATRAPCPRFAREGMESRSPTTKSKRFFAPWLAEALSTRIATSSREQEFAEKRQLFLTEQGYPYRIMEAEELVETVNEVDPEREKEGAQETQCS